jgi:dTDP-4-amino-4,6-dideoxygalactose transaminase
MADMDHLLTFARQHSLHIIEDCAQAIGATRNGVKAGTSGAFGAFSFYPTKNLSGFGDGGFVCTQDAELSKKARILRIHGMDPVYYHSEVGGNFRFDPIQGALLRIKLPHLDAQNARRNANARHYHQRLAQHPLVGTGSSASPDHCIVLPDVDQGNLHTWHQFTLRVQGAGKRDALVSFLKERQIGCGVYYPLGLHQQQCFRSVVPEGTCLPETEKASQEVVSLPIFPELEPAQLDEVCDALLNFLNR